MRNERDSAERATEEASRALNTNHAQRIVGASLPSAKAFSLDLAEPWLCINAPPGKDGRALTVRRLPVLSNNFSNRGVRRLRVLVIAEARCTRPCDKVIGERLAEIRILRNVEVTRKPGSVLGCHLSGS